jgi:hypothetical protein
MSLAGHGRIDDLFEADEPVAPEETGGGLPSVIWPALGTTLVLALIGELLFRLLGFAPPLLLVVAVAAGIAAIRSALGAVREPLIGRLGELVRARPPGDPRVGRRADGMRDAIRRWTRRLEWGSTGPQRYSNAVAPHLAELADQRLRQQYGLTMASDPARARAVLGEAAWAVLNPRPGATLDHRQVVQTVAALMKL